MKKFVTLFLLTLLPFVASAADKIEIDGICYYLNSSDEAKTASVTSKSGGYSGDIVIPESVTYEEVTYSVTSIGYDAFAYDSDLTSVTLPNNVTSIGSEAFYCCEDLTSIIIPNSVTSIGNSAFYRCSGLTSITIPNSVTSIGDFAFYECSGLKSVTILCVSTSIGTAPFQGCYNLKEVTFDCESVVSLFNNVGSVETVTLTEKVSTIGEAAFSGFSGLTSITIPTSVTSIGQFAFSGCSGLTSVTIPNSVTTIGSSAFANCSGLTSITIPNSVTSIGEKTFSDCRGLTSITIPNNVTTIGNSAFSYCGGLTSITIPNSVTSIGGYAFYGCGGLTSVVIGSGITSIGSYAFSNTNLKKTIWLTNTPPSGASEAAGAVNYVANDQFSFRSKVVVVYPFLSSYFDVDGIWYVPVSLSDKTCDAIDCLYDESARDIKISSTVTNKGVTLSVKNIMPYIGYGNKFVESLSIECNGGIGNYAFFSCSALQTVVLNAKGEIGNYAFSDGSNINSVELGNTITSIGVEAFKGCASFEEIRIKPAITEIGNSAFSHCTNLKKFIIEDSDVELKLGARIVESCQLDSVYIGRNINYPTSKSEGYSPFYSNTSLRAVKITDKETEISENEFYGCTNLQRVIIGDGVTSIGNRAFSGCSSLKFFTFGSEVKTIGQEAFSDCTAVTEITSRAIAPPTCGAQALDDINKWDCKLYVPKGYLASYQAAEQWKEFLFVEEGDYTIAKKYTLTYIVDGEEYKSYQIAEGSAITPEPAPTKEGYEFSGWSTIPATMPAEDVTITGTFLLATDVDEITIKDTGKTTWCSEYDLDFTNVEGVKAYTATGYNNITKTIWLTRVMEVPAGTGILVKGDAGTYKIPHAEVQSAYANWFVGNLGETISISATDGDKTNYYLSGKDGTFKSVNGNANIGKNKAYLQLPTSVFGGTRSIGISYDDEDGTTSIKDLTPALSEGEGAWYTLQGQRVAKPGKGLYIKNGKKVIVR